MKRRREEEDVTPEYDSKRQKTVHVDANEEVVPDGRNDPEFEEAMDLLARGNLFITGDAGTGKTYRLRQLIRHYAKLPEDGLAITATTGIAATHLNGTTVHSFAGIGQGKESLETYVKRLGYDKMGIATRWRNTQVLIIDEISMMSADLFTLLDHLGRRLRGKPYLPFGGIKLIVCGDFFQLPPVPEKGEVTTFAFESESWAAADFGVLELTTCHRQQDPVFTKMLNEIRLGICSEETAEMLRSRQKPRETDIAMHLYAFNYEADQTNSRKLDEIADEKEVIYDAVDEVPLAKDRNQYMGMVKSLKVTQRLVLKVGAQVMCLINVSIPDIVNGSQGKVIGFERGRPIVRFQNGMVKTIDQSHFNVTVNEHVLGTRRQYPLRLAWAISIHKSQGMTIEGATEMSLGRELFCAGQAYVALSRLRNIDQLSLLDFDPSAIRADTKVINFYKNLTKKKDRHLFSTGIVVDNSNKEERYDCID